MKSKHSVLFCSLLGAVAPIHAEVLVNGGISASAVSYNVDSQLFEEDSAETIAIEPFLSTSVQTRRFTLKGDVSQQHMERSLDDDSNERNKFTKYNVRSSFMPIDNMLSFSAGSYQRYLNLEQSDQFVYDLFLGSSNLTETRANDGGFSFNLPNPTYVGVSLGGNISNIKSDNQANTSRPLDVTNRSLSGSIYQGNRFDRVSWNITGSYADSEGRTRNLKSRNLNANLLVPLIGDFRLLLTGSSERNQISNRDDFASNDLDYDSYGVGLTWAPSDARSLSLTYNQSERLENGDKQEFVGADINWAFSARTSLQASYSRRFFGESGNLNFNYSLKNLRVTVGYTERVTNFSRLVINSQSLGSFVCNQTEAGLDNCFLPDTLDYELQPDEVFEEIFIDLPTIDERSILRKSLRWNTAYSHGKLRVSLNFSNSSSEYLETGRKADSDMAIFSTRYNLGVRTNVSWSLQYMRTSGDFTAGFDTRTRRSKFEIRRELTRSTDASLFFRYLEKDSFNPAQEIQDRRLGLTIEHKF